MITNIDLDLVEYMEEKDEWIEVNMTWSEFNWNAKDKTSLALPGTLIEMKDGSQYLIGHINPSGGICNDCMEFDTSYIVKRYKIVWKE
jgi:hypothetical protein